MINFRVLAPVCCDLAHCVQHRGVVASAKQLTNFRVSGKEDAIKITPPIQLTLEYAVQFIEDDELAEITPKSIRLRKRFLKEHERKRASREA